MALEQDDGITVEEQRQVLVSVAMTPKAAWLPAPDPLAVRAKRLARWGAAACTAAVLALIALPERKAAYLGEVGPIITPSTVDGNAWRESGRASIRVWPSRGSLLDDTTLIRAATRAWAVADPQLLYAGDATGQPVVMLTDGNRVARYSPGSPLDVSALSSEDVYGTSVLRLGGGYYLAAPWVSGLEAAPIGTAGRILTIGEGIAGPVAPGADCRHITVLRVRIDGILPQEPFTLGDTGSVHPAHLMYIPPVIAGTIGRPHEADAEGGSEAFAAAGCRLAALTAKPLRSLTIWEFQRAALPDGVTGRWLCARADRIDGGSSVSVLLAAGDPAGTQQLFDGAGNRLCSRQEHDLAVGTWWSGERGWHYLGAASRAVGQLSITVGGQRKSGRGTVSIGPFAAPVDGATVTASRDGNAVPVVTAGPPP